MRETVEIGPITADDIARYAEAAGDSNPIHLDPAFARSVGLPAQVAHGMWVMAQFERLIGERASGRRIEAFSVRFAKPVPVGSTLVVQSRIAQATQISPGTARTLLRLLASVDRVIVCIGTATLVGPPIAG